MAAEAAGGRSVNFPPAVRSATVSETTMGTRAVVNANWLRDRGDLTSTPVVHDFDGETIETKSSRHAMNWMPAIINR